MKTRVIEINANNIMELLDAIMSGNFDKELHSEKKVNKIECEVPSSASSYYMCIVRIAKRMGWKPEKVASFLSNLWRIQPSAAFSVLLREIAVALDENYEGHINECEKLFIISLMDGRIHEVPRTYIKNFRNFAAFRTLEDAKTACKILRKDLKEMFKSCDK